MHVRASVCELDVGRSSAQEIQSFSLSGAVAVMPSKAEDGSYRETKESKLCGDVSARTRT